MQNITNLYPHKKKAFEHLNNFIKLQTDFVYVLNDYSSTKNIGLSYFLKFGYINCHHFNHQSLYLKLPPSFDFNYSKSNVLSKYLLKYFDTDFKDKKNFDDFDHNSDLFLDNLRSYNFSDIYLYCDLTNANYKTVLAFFIEAFSIKTLKYTDNIKFILGLNTSFFKNISKNPEKEFNYLNSIDFFNHASMITIQKPDIHDLSEHINLFMKKYNVDQFSVSDMVINWLFSQDEVDFAMVNDFLAHYNKIKPEEFVKTWQLSNFKYIYQDYVSNIFKNKSMKFIADIDKDDKKVLEKDLDKDYHNNKDEDNSNYAFSA